MFRKYSQPSVAAGLCSGCAGSPVLRGCRKGTWASTDLGIRGGPRTIPPCYQGMTIFTSRSSFIWATSTPVKVVRPFDFQSDTSCFTKQLSFSCPWAPMCGVVSWPHHVRGWIKWTCVALQYLLHSVVQSPSCPWKLISTCLFLCTPLYLTWSLFNTILCCHAIKQ